MEVARLSHASLMGLAVLWMMGAPQETDAQICGDWNCSQTLTSTDTYAIYNYLAEEGPGGCSGLDSGDVDDHENLSLRDGVFIFRHIFGGEVQLTCPPTSPALSIQPSQDFYLTHTKSVPANVNRCTVDVEIIHHRKVFGVLVGFKMLIGGDTLPNFNHSYFFYVFGGPSGRSHQPGGLWRFGFSAIPGNFPSEGGRRLVARFDMALPPSPSERMVTLSLVNMDTVINWPEVDQSTSVLDEDYVMRELHSVWDSCPVRMTGDGDMNSALTSSDIIRLVNYVFKSGAPPNPCSITGDVNCDLSVSSSDVIVLVNHIFKGGVGPCDACAVYSAPWGCLVN